MNLTRRGFIGGLLATAAVRTWPFRVFSFPTEVAIAQPGELGRALGFEYTDNLRIAAKHMAETLENLLPKVYPTPRFNQPLLVGAIEKVRVPRLIKMETVKGIDAQWDFDPADPFADALNGRAKNIRFAE